MITSKKIATVAALAVFTSYSGAAVIKATVSTGGASSQTAYDADISTTDLINVGQPTWDGTIIASTAPSFSINGSNDGLDDDGTGSGVGLTFWNSGATQTLTFNLAGSATGYDITSIVSIYGWANGAHRFSEQNYSISFATVGNPTLTLFDSIAYDPFGDSDGDAASSKVTWTEDTTNVLASGVTAIRFTFTSSDSSAVVGVIREIDVFGSATAIPEPSSITLFGFAGLALVLRRRR